MHFYDFNIGDFAKKTQHLTNEEELAYRRALDMYYDTEKPLISGGLATLSRRLRVDENALKNVLEEFFPDGKNKHADEKIAEYYKYIDKQKANGRKGGRPKSDKKEPTANPTLSQNNPVPSQPLTTKPLTTNNKQHKTIVTFSKSRFDDFWKEYPSSQRKVGKSVCEKKWQSKKLSLQADAIIAHIRAIKNSQQWKDGFSPAPLTYINQERWHDEIFSDTAPTPDWKRDML